VICIGDWEQKKQMKFKEPTIGKGMRTLFRKNNYKVFLVDEFRTSCKCSNCNGGVCEKFRLGKNLIPNSLFSFKISLNSQSRSYHKLILYYYDRFLNNSL
jgi:hypothetical protein